MFLDCAHLCSLQGTAEQSVVFTVDIGSESSDTIYIMTTFYGARKARTYNNIKLCTTMLRIDPTSLPAICRKYQSCVSSSIIRTRSFIFL